MPLTVSFLWHMHQPDYRDPHTGQPRMPWVRLHAVRGYYDMARALELAPKGVSATVNFVPSLVDQLRDAANGSRDEFVRLALLDSAALTLDERAFLLKHFFSVSHDTGVSPRPRYASLHGRRGDPRDPASLRRAAALWSPDDLRDLATLFFLSWFGWAARDDLPRLAELEAKGQHFTEAEKREVIDLGDEIVRRVLPAYRALADQGKAELSATPYAHPILPLLCDTEAAGRALPLRPRPPRLCDRESALWHVETACDYHAAQFGAPPLGMWPAEGSISPEVVPLFSGAGISWIASDEGNLLLSTDPPHDRDDLITRPWRLEGSALDIVFRDRDLSDRIGFAYSKRPPEEAALDLLHRAEALAVRFPDEERALFVILDGENPWEHYPDGGRGFLTHVYQGLATRPGLRGRSIGEALHGLIPRGKLARLHSGSWIESSFRIWIGGPEENRAWSLLGHLKNALDTAPRLDAARRRTAEEHLHAAQASDWFWWYGDDFVSEEKDIFDGLFRARLLAAYEALGVEPPAAARAPLHKDKAHHHALALHELHAPHGQPPRWENAPSLELHLSGGSMAMARPFARVRLAVAEGALRLRLEPPDGQPAPQSGCTISLTLHGTHGEAALTLSPERPVPHDHESARGAGAWGEAVECMLELPQLGQPAALRVAVWLHGLPAGEAWTSLRPADT
jgi:alpha-amylase/alpha-mannosidase (GH57 family)